MNVGTVDYRSGERKVERIPLSFIVTSHNPRRNLGQFQSHLIEDGFVGGNGVQVPLSPLELIQEFALSDDPQRRAQFAALMDKRENYPKGILELAASRLGNEIEPIVLRSFRVQIPGTENYTEKYGIVVGERRCLAAAYNYAKHGTTGDIGALVRKLTVDEAYDLAVAENAQRKDLTDLEYGMVFRDYRGRKNPATGQNYTLKEIATKFNMDYQYVRSREALAYLDEADQKRLEAGTLGVTTASEKGLRIKQGKDNGDQAKAKKLNRDRVMTKREVEELFDDNRNQPHPFLRALAMVMHMKLEVAAEESDTRIKAAEAAEIAIALKADKKALKQMKKGN